MKNLTLNDVCNLLNVDLPTIFFNMKNYEFSKLVYTLMYVEPGCALFLKDSALHENPDLEIEQCLNDGAVIIFITKQTFNKLTIDGPFILVDNIAESASEVAAYIRSRYHNPIIGVTGSLGKTTTKDLIHEILNINNNPNKSLGNENTLAPLLKNLQKLDDDVDYFVQEYGAGTPGTILKTIAGCIPDVAIITNIYDSHIGAYGTRDNILKDKLELIKMMPKGNSAFLNYDDVLLKELKLEDYDITSYGINNKDVDYHAENIVELNGHIDFDVVHNDNRIHATIYLRGRHNVYNALAAFAVAEHFNIPEKEILLGLSTYRTKGIRQSFTNVGGYDMFLDTYNSAPQSLLSTMHVLENLEPKNNGRRIAIVCEIMKLGEHEERINRGLGEKFKDLKIDVIYSFGNENARLLIEEAGKNGTEVHYTSKREDLNNWLKENVTTDDILMFKGIRHLERTVDQLYGSNYFMKGEFYSYITKGDFKFKIIYEYYDFNLKTAAVFKYLGNDKSVTIPDNFDDIPITYIYPGCFKDNETIENVDIPNTITCISAGAFRNCTNLKDVHFPDSLLSIKQNAFRNCKSLKNVDLPYGILQVDDKAFMNCKELDTVVLPGSINLYGDKIFKGVPKYKLKCLDKNGEDYFVEQGYKLKFRNLKKASKLSFNVTGLVDNQAEIVIPETYKNLRISAIGKKAFYKNNGITSVHLPEGIKSIGKKAFYGCKNITYVSLPLSLNKIHDNSFPKGYRIKFDAPKKSYASEALKLNTLIYKLHRMKYNLFKK